MTDYFIVNILIDWIPTISYDLPYFGTVDFTKAVAASIIFAALTFLFWLLRHVVLVWLRRMSKKTRTKSDDVIISAVQHIHGFVYTVAALYLSLQVFDLRGDIDQVITAIFYVVLTWQVIRILSGLVKYFSEAKLKEADENGEFDPNAATAAEMITLLARITLWILGLLFVLSNLGIEITSLIAGLGIGGIAVAFALQGILSDLFASFSLYFDKPFRIGDHIVVGSDAGIVEKIGIKTTRIRTLQGEELVVSNAELTTARVQNFKKMKERRGTTRFGVLYETPHEKLEMIKDVVTSIIDEIENTRLKRAFFTRFGDSALEFEVVYYVDSSDYNDFLTAQEQFNFALLKKFAELDIHFAYPTQTIYTKSA